MKRVLLTGMSGTGKSTVLVELAARGFRAVDTDQGGLTIWTGTEWLWREDRIQRLLATDDAGALFLGGCVRNQVTFYPQLDHVILLSAPVPVMVERLATRTTNDYGKHPDELAEVLESSSKRSSRCCERARRWRWTPARRWTRCSRRSSPTRGCDGSDHDSK